MLFFSYKYSIIEGNEDGIFDINSTNGSVFLSQTDNPGQRLGQKRIHTLVVQALNSQSDCQRARIRINIITTSCKLYEDDICDLFF